MDDGGEVDSNTLKQVISVGLVAFAGLSVVIVAVAALSKRRQAQKNIKIYGTPFAPKSKTNSASAEALEGTAGLSAQGGVESDAAWDDDVASLDFTVQDEDLDASDEPSTTIDASSLYGEEDSLEDIAGMPTQPKAEPETLAPEVAETPSAGPPLPASGLPDGWTMDQWKWYGQEWLDKQK